MSLGGNADNSIISWEFYENLGKKAELLRTSDYAQLEPIFL